MGSPCCQKVHEEQRLAPDGLLRQEADPKYILSPLPPLGTGHRRFKIPGPKGLETLRPVLNEEPVGLGNKGSLEIQQFKTVLGSCEVTEQGLNWLVLRNKIKYKLFTHPNPSVQSKVHTKAEATGRTSDGEQSQEYKRGRSSNLFKIIL